jgi:signal transduction histidine kinase
MTVLETLRTMPILADCSDDQLAWVHERGEVVELPAGALAYAEGDRDTGFWLLLSGSVEVWRSAEGVATSAGATDYVGAWGGQIPLTGDPAMTTLKVVTDARLFRLANSDAEHMVRSGYPIAGHLIAGIQAGTRIIEARRRTTDRLAALSRLSAGLSHELNNPAAAANRAAVQLAGAHLELVEAALVAAGAPALAGAYRELAAAPPPVLSALDRSDAEEELADRLEELGAGDVEAASDLLDAGVDRDWLDTHLSAADCAPPAALVRLVAAAAAVGALAADVHEATARMSRLVAAVKTYSNMDGAPECDVDVNAGLESTLVLLGARLRGVTVVRDLAPDLPLVAADPGGLNQVWTNLLDNAVDATGGSGTLRIRTRRDGRTVLVEVTDDGTGIPADALDHVFEPFFTTKPVGSGAGLGLDVVWRIVAGLGGSVTVDSAAGAGSTFRVILPITRADAVTDPASAADALPPAGFGATH